jgi:hypothetical protein
MGQKKEVLLLKIEIKRKKIPSSFTGILLTYDLTSLRNSTSARIKPTT